ncbi:AAA family ATPase [Enterococcus casseliflavus]|uniref:AAA family ATPase n=3 Tax=Enterococcus casseliflavus TaxID=37734 RepID=UPI000763FA71|nr:ATP-binding protein [Enterococcus casseliflavus]OJG28929.1 hypothetical protein RU99_GL002112 [Enterococcus casseliflavus]QQU24740.1 ATP-binding protein [Enterococcus casseliflavus]
MIIEFKVENFKSIKDEQKLSFIATGIKEIPGSIKQYQKDNIKILKSATMYGANASGKSNIIDSIKFFQRFVTTSFKESEGNDKINVLPFIFSEENRTKPSNFEISFFLTDTEIVTYGFSANEEKVLKEYLYMNDKEYFLRDDNGYKFIKNMESQWSIRKELLNDNSLFLSLLASTNDELGSRIFNWIKNDIIAFSALRNLNDYKTKAFLKDNNSLRKQIIRLTKIADLDIKYIDTIENNELPDLDMLPKEFLNKFLEDNKTLLTTTHDLKNNIGENIGEVTIKSGIDNFESAGTIQYLALLGHIIDSINNGKTLIIDELGAQFHPIMSRAIINLFNDSKNQKGQLFFTTHDVTNLTNDIFRRDQIWFAEKDKFSSTQITSLIEYKFNNAKIRNDENYSKNYMQGKYGAIPFINFSYSELFDEDSSLEKDGEVSNGQI